MRRIADADFVTVKTLDNQGNDFPDITESDGPVYGSYPNQSIISYMSDQPNELKSVPSDAGETEFVETAEEGAILVSQGDEVVVTGLNSSDNIQVMGVRNDERFYIETYRVY